MYSHQFIENITSLDESIEILKFADKFQIDLLKTKIEYIIRLFIDKKTAINIYDIAIRFNSCFLKSSCCAYFMNNQSDFINFLKNKTIFLLK